MHEYVDTTGDVGTYASLRIDSEGFAHSIYRNATNEFLRYARNNEPLTGIQEAERKIAPVPCGFAIRVFPNPFTDRTEITCQEPDIYNHAYLEIYNAAVGCVTSFYIAPHALRSTLSWDRCDEHGRELSRGVYFLHGVSYSAHDSEYKTVVKKILFL